MEIDNPIYDALVTQTLDTLASMKRRLHLMEIGHMSVRLDDGSGQSNKTPEWIAFYKEEISKHEALLARLETHKLA